MNEIENLLSHLEDAVRQFPLLHMEAHALPEFHVRLERLARELKRSKLTIRAQTLAPLLKERARNMNMDETKLRTLIKTLRLKSIVLKDNKDWYAYELRGPQPEAEPLSEAISLAPRRLKHALIHARKHGRIDIEVHCIHMDQWIFMSATPNATIVEIEANAKHPLVIAFQPVASYVFVNKRSLPVATATAIATGLGWSRAVNANLTGRHLDSLLRVLEQDRNGSLHGLLTTAAYANRPVVAQDGLVAEDEHYNMEYAKGILGREPPKLRKLEGTIRQTFCDEPDSDPIHVSLTIHSEDVASTLEDMVRIKAIHPDSVWLHSFRSTTTNTVDLDEIVMHTPVFGMNT